MAPSEKVKAFFAAYPQKSFSKQQQIVSAGEPLPGVLYIESGRIAKYDITPAGNEAVVNIYKPGAFFPMSWALNGTANDYFFEASVPTTVRVAPPIEALQFLKDNPDVTLDLLSRVYRGTDGILRRMVHLMSGDTKSRLLFELLNATYRFGEHKDDGSIFIALSENDLARHAGMARETVNRNIQSIKADGLVEITRLGITVKDVSAIEKLLASR